MGDLEAEFPRILGCRQETVIASPNEVMARQSLSRQRLRLLRRSEKTSGLLAMTVGIFFEITIRT
jgi:hypothetical protein